jgi:hypothetical protein
MRIHPKDFSNLLAWIDKEAQRITEEAMANELKNPAPWHSAFPWDQSGDRGLTVRQYFAVQILQGIMADSRDDRTLADKVNRAITTADMLILGLNATEK